MEQSHAHYCAQLRAATASAAIVTRKNDSSATHRDLCASERNHAQKIRNGEIKDPTLFGGSAGQYAFGRGGNGDSYLLREDPSERIIKK